MLPSAKNNRFGKEGDSISDNVADESRQCVLYFTNPNCIVESAAAEIEATEVESGSASRCCKLATDQSQVQTYGISNDEFVYSNDDDDDDEEEDTENDDDLDMNLNMNDIDDCGDYEHFAGLNHGSRRGTANDDMSARTGSTQQPVEQEASALTGNGSSFSAVVFIGGSSQQLVSLDDVATADAFDDTNSSCNSSGLGSHYRHQGSGSQQCLVSGSSSGGHRAGWSSRSSDWFFQSTDSGSFGPSGRTMSCRRCLVSCIRSRPCLFFVYVVLVLVMLSSCVSLVLVGVLVAEPFARVSTFQNTTCAPVEVLLSSASGSGRQSAGDQTAPTGLSPTTAEEQLPANSLGIRPEVVLQTCSCGKGCNSKYRCIRIHVQYQLSDGSFRTGVLYEDETSLNRQCSFYPPCRSSRLDNEHAVADYDRRFGRLGVDPYSCWYNPAQKSEVIQHRRFQLHHVINGIVWSSVLLILSTVSLVFVVRRKNFFKFVS